MTDADREAARNVVLRVIYGSILDRAVSVSIPGVINFDHAVDAAITHRIQSTAALQAQLDMAVAALTEVCEVDHLHHSHSIALKALTAINE